MEDHDLAGQRILAAVSATRPAAGVSQGALLRSLESGQQDDLEEATAVAGGKKQERGGRQAGSTGTSSETYLSLLQ